MNSHLNVFKTFSKEESTYQLENDLTRAFAICLQEDALFFHEVLKVIFNDDKELELLLSNVETENKLYINIQESSSDIKTYDRIISVSLSENEMNIESFKNQVHLKKYDPICDIVIILNEIVIIVEAKRDNVDFTAQLFNQAYNIVKNSNNTENYTGRNIKSNGDWSAIEQLFDDYFAQDYNWREALNWQEKVINTNKTQFDLSFGYELFVVIPFHELKKRDTLSTNLDGLTGLIASIYRSFENDLIK